MSVDIESTCSTRPPQAAEWRARVSPFQSSSLWRACWQIVNSVGAYVLAWYLMYLSLGVSWWLTVPLAVLAGGLLIRIFIIFHDCGHGSFFRSKRANLVCGFICGALTFTPYRRWRWEHARHHATSGNLDRRGIGDIWTLNVQEYIDAPRSKRIAYRVVRNPLVMFIIGPLFLMLVQERLPSANGNVPERRSVWWTNLTVLGQAIGLSMLFGIAPYALIQLIILMVAGSAGVWLFYVQHQFEDGYWERGENWDYIEAALRGSSFYKLPKVLQWFSGNIGLHHIHHLSARIPNYNLQRCHESHSTFRDVKVMTLRSSLKSLPLRLWDESEKRLVSFRHLSAAQRGAVNL
jgi:omega-6 fatty acid desaturase (delta-12 desaturase)